MSLLKSHLNSQSKYQFSCEIAGENSFTFYFKQIENSPDRISDAAIISIVAAISQEVQLKMLNSVINVIPSYHTLFVVFDPLKITFSQCQALVESLIVQFDSDLNDKLNDKSQSGDKASTHILELPVYYHESVGIDLARMAKHAQLSIEEVIRLHQQQTYQVNAIGFAPGFAYMGDVNSKISMPRLASPRLTVPKGAVAIAENQTAVYPAESPGGWNIIGRCPITLFDPNKTPAMPLSVGDSVRFKAIDKATFIDLGGEL